MKNILLIGAGRFGRHIAMQLSQLEHQIMAVDIDEERINDILPSSPTRKLETVQTRSFFAPLASEISMSAS